MTEIEKKVQKKLARIKGKDTAEMSAQEIMTLLDNVPEASVYLYKLVNTQNYVKDDCEELCEYLIRKENPREIIPKKYTKVTYAGICKKEKCGWKQKDYRIKTRDGYPGKMITPEERKNLDSCPIRSLSERELELRIFTQGRKTGKLDPIPQLGYILDYEMPIGGKNKELYTIKSGQEYHCERQHCPYGIHILPGSDRLFATGKCDLVAYDNEQFMILELKDADSSEPLIRAVLEAYTYKQLLNTDEAAKSLKKHYRDIISEGKEIKWRTAPLLYVGYKQHEEYMEKKGRKSKLIELMEKLDIQPIWYDIDDEKNEIKICDG